MPSPVALFPATSENTVDQALDACHDALDLALAAGTVTVSRAALMAVLEHHAALAKTADTLRMALAQREADDDRAPICAPCTRIRRGM